VVAGGVVTGGLFLDQDGKGNKTLFRVFRGSKKRPVLEGASGLSLRKFKDQVKEVGAGEECGLSLVDFADLQEGDDIECYVNAKIPQTL